MRNQILLFFIACAFTTQAWAQETEFPYNAIVLNDGAQVRSGPGDSHYATHKLDENELVQVHRHDPGGWCAIRPPAKSFSLIPESAVRIVVDDIAEVLANGSQAWVGTGLGPVDKPLWQVKLKKGERVVIVGEASWPHPSGKSVVWYQIEPPAGEYRWIRISDLQLPPRKDVATKIDYSEPPSLKEKPSSFTSATVTTTFTSDNSPSDNKEPEFKSITSAPVTSGWKAATRPIPDAEPAKPKYSGTFHRSVRTANEPHPSFIEQATFQLEEEHSDPRFESWDGRRIEPARSPDRYASLESMDRQVKSFVRERGSSDAPPMATVRSKSSSVMQIEEQLSNEILKDPRSWELANLKFETERARAGSNDPVERLALQHVLDKIEKCDGICKGYQQAGSHIPQSGGGSTSRTAAANRTPYDASGWLKRLASSSGSIDPVYVLQDSIGNVTHEIVGMTGMNLSQYVDKQIGVVGRRGYNSRLKLNHVTANRVIVLR